MASLIKLVIIIGLAFIAILASPSSLINAQPGPSPTATSTFTAIHNAEVNGANIQNLVSQYNILLGQPSNTSDVAFQQLNNQATQLQDASIAARNTRLVLIIVLVVLIALILTSISVLAISATRRIYRKKLLEMRILNN